MTAFVHNRRAEVLSTLGEAGAIEEFLSLLDRAFPRSQSGNSSHLSLARETFIRGGLMDWSKEPYIEAGCGLSQLKGTAALACIVGITELHDLVCELSCICRHCRGHYAF